MNALVRLFLIVTYICGIAIAVTKGFWMTVLCIFVPIASWVVVVLRLMGQY